MRDPVKIFFSYAHEDEELMHRIRRQLIVFDRRGDIAKRWVKFWHDRMIKPGSDWQDEIDDELYSAQIILLCVSPDFIASKYCYGVEMQAALSRHESGKAKVIPIILRPCAWEAAPFGHLQALPRDGRPITKWGDRDEACLSVARGVMQVANRISGGTPDW